MAQEIIEVPLTGKITSVNVKPGDKVDEGDVLCLLESMKMENPILAPVSGTVTYEGKPVEGAQVSFMTEEGGIPDRYSDAKKSGLTAEVKPGDTKPIDFDLKP